MNLTDFVSWDVLATYAGAVAMVNVLTQVTKNVVGINKIPTQLWSYALALVVLYCASFFTGTLTASVAVLTLFNGFLVSMTANGVYEGIQRTKVGEDK